MQQLWNAITAGVVPLLLSALALIVPAAAAYAVAWLKAQTALQEQAIRNAVDHVDALKAPAAVLPARVAKAVAMDLVAVNLGLRPNDMKMAKVSEQIDAVVAEKRRASLPPTQ